MILHPRTTEDLKERERALRREHKRRLILLNHVGCGSRHLGEHAGDTVGGLAEDLADLLDAIVRVVQCSPGPSIFLLEPEALEALELRPPWGARAREAVDALFSGEFFRRDSLIPKPWNPGDPDR